MLLFAITSPIQNAVYSLPPDKLAKAIALSHARTLAHFGGTTWVVLVLGLLVWMRAGAHIGKWAARISNRKWVQGLMVAPIWLLLLSALDLPASIFMERLYRAYGISVESWAMWAGDFAKSLALTLIFGTLVLSVLYALMQYSPRRWWLWFWLLALPVEVFAIFVVPIVIDPLFDHFSPLMKSNPALVDQLERVAARGGLHIPPERMFVMDASAKLTAPNAYVTGFGASKRIVVWDTTLQKVPADEILAIYGHEQGHYVLQHIRLGLIFSSAVMFVFFWIGYRMMTWFEHRGIAVVSEWSSLGLLLLLVTILGFVAQPVGNAFSRWEEHAADVYGQEVIEGLVPDARASMVQSFQRLGELWLEDPAPNRFVVFWTYSHPPVPDRLRFAARYNPAQPRYVAK
jgi:STE24 endopeptidase